MSKDRKKPRKVRVDFRPNRQDRPRSDDWTKRYHEQTEEIADTERTESVRPKGELSRKRTILVDQDDVPRIDEALWRPGTVTIVHGLICYVEDQTGQRWECTVRRILRTRLIEQRAPIVVGDRVWFAAISEPVESPKANSSNTPDVKEIKRVGVIERIEERRTLLSRRVRQGHDTKRERKHGGQKPEKIGREHAIVANADQLLIVASVAQPRLKPHLIDRYIVAALKGQLRPLICFNKVDLQPEMPEIEDEDEEFELTFERLAEEYVELGYRCLQASATTGVGIDKLRAALQNHMTVVAGQSGVGKSSLINAVQPGLELAVQEVSEESEKGRHTTTHARLLRLNGGGYVVDTPGIRAFDLWDIGLGELEAYFVEFLPYISQCRFADCTHRHEEGCAVLAAVEEGKISERRYWSYLKMFGEV